MMACPARPLAFAKVQEMAGIRLVPAQLGEGHLLHVYSYPNDEDAVTVGNPDGHALRADTVVVPA